MSDPGQSFGHEVTGEHVAEDTSVYDSEAEQANVAINAHDQLGFLLPSQFAASNTLRLYEVPTEDNPTEDTK